MRARRRPTPDPEATRLQLQRNAELVALASHPSWPAMREEVDYRREQIKQRVLTIALSEGPVDQRQIDFLRGVMSGITWLAGVPERSERSLEKALADAIQTGEENAA